MARDFGMLVVTGHIDPVESLPVAAGAVERDPPVIFACPLSRSVSATIEQMREGAQIGATLEITCLQLIKGKVAANQVVELLQGIGADHWIVTGDAFGEWIPPMPELLRAGPGRLLEADLAPGDAAALVRENPRRIAARLHLDSRSPDSSAAFMREKKGDAADAV